MLLNKHSKNSDMGNLFSRRSVAQQSPRKKKENMWTWQTEQDSNPPSTPRERRPLRREDFIFVSRKGESLVKEAGSIDGQAFAISDCENCDVFLLDHSDSVTVDNCVNCRFFIGPVGGSVFIRNTRDCKFVVACQQLRTRDTKNCDFLAHVSTNPSIEESSGLRFGCFQYFYFQLKDQFNKAKLSVFNNVWYKVYDFTPSGRPHYSFLPKDMTCHQLLKPLNSFSSIVGEGEECNLALQEEVVPMVFSPYYEDIPHRFALLFLPGSVNDAMGFLDYMRSSSLSEKFLLIATKEAMLNGDELDNFLSHTRNKSSLRRRLQGPFVLLVFGSYEALKPTLERSVKEKIGHESYYLAESLEEVHQMERALLDRKH